MADHSCDGQAAARRFGVVVIAVVPVRISHDGLTAYFVEGDLLSAVAPGCGNGNHRTYALREAHRPFQGLHASHGPAGHAKQPFNTERINQFLLQTHHIANGDDREPEPVRAARGSVDGTRPRGALTAPQNVGADDEKTIGVERLARTNHALPPAGLAPFDARSTGMRIAGKCVRDEHCVGAVRIERAPRFPRDLNRSQGCATGECNVVEPRYLGAHSHREASC